MSTSQIYIVLDRSGSMQAIANDVTGGLKSFFEEQKQVPVETLVTLVQFDTQFETVYEGINLQEVPEFVFQPRGGTALLDAMGRTYSKIKASLAINNNAKIMCVVITDGEENSSIEFTRETVFGLSKELEAAGVEILFLAANQDAIQSGGALGISGAKSMTFAYNGTGINESLNSLSKMSMAYRSGEVGTMNFSDADRELQAKAGA